MSVLLRVVSAIALTLASGTAFGQSLSENRALCVEHGSRDPRCQVHRLLGVDRLAADRRARELDAAKEDNQSHQPVAAPAPPLVDGAAFPLDRSRFPLLLSDIQPQLSELEPSTSRVVLDALLFLALADALGSPFADDDLLTPGLLMRPSGRICAENGSCYGDISPLTGRPKTVRVRSYWQRDGYVRGHFRSRPRR